MGIIIERCGLIDHIPSACLKRALCCAMMTHQPASYLPKYSMKPWISITDNKILFLSETDCGGVEQGI